MQISAKRRHQGVTLIELLVTMSIAVILLTVGVGGMTTVVKRNARATEVNAMIGHLNYARAQAVMRAMDITVCPVDRANPAAGCASGADSDSWVNGYAVVEVETGQVLRLEGATRQLLVRSFKLSGAPLDFTFEDDGSLAARANGNVRFCDPNPGGIEGRSVIVALTGRVRVQTDGVDCSWAQGS